MRGVSGLDSGLEESALLEGTRRGWACIIVVLLVLCLLSELRGGSRGRLCWKLLVLELGYSPFLIRRGEDLPESSLSEMIESFEICSCFQNERFVSYFDVRSG